MFPNPPKKLNLANLPTPFRLLKRLGEYLGGPKIWLKSDDQSGLALSGNKIRKLEFLLADALEQGCDTIITCGGEQSNHCRATAAACARLGLNCVLLLRRESNPQIPDQSGGNFLLDHLFGATVHLFDKTDYLKNLQLHFDELIVEFKQCGRKPYTIPTGASNGLGAWGYINACDEMRSDFVKNDLNPDFIVCASGSGGTQAGLILGSIKHNFSAKVRAYAVCDSADYFEKKVKSDIADWGKVSGLCDMQIQLLMKKVVVDTNEEYIGDGYGRLSPSQFESMQELARLEGIILDPVYTGKAFHGLLCDIKAGLYSSCKDIVFVHTGGAFGLFPYSDTLAEFVDYN